MPNPGRQSVLFPALLPKAVSVAFDEPTSTSDGGAVLVAGADRRLGLTGAFSAALRDDRDGSRVRHEVLDLVRQRVYGLACGYEDANDVEQVGWDPLFQLLLGKHPREGGSLASQPTISRFENRAEVEDLGTVGDALAETVLGRHRKRLRKRARRVTLDLDLTDDATHGAQQLSLFNGHYRSWCYLPLLGFVSFNDEPEQYLVSAVLRRGRTPTGEEIVALLEPLLEQVRQAFPKARIRVRLDGGFAGPILLDFLEESRVEYVIGLAGNNVLRERSGKDIARVRRKAKRLNESVAEYGETRYSAKSWKGRERRVIYKVEVTQLEGRELRDNPRYVVTNLRHSPENVYVIYRSRGDVENRIKELKDDLAIDRTSCNSFLANSLRVLLTAAAYALMQELRLYLLRRTKRRWQVGTIRLRLLKIGGRVHASVRRLVVHLAESHPWQREWHAVARACGALPA
jgi:hypothetical protein